ncbi:hypothetical protein [Corynebacterium epidermidicanis]|uniref:Uncharacterized protein n=1 Tax=Corynebacterium epidermidicanis TaxID=1050174 RepID=A0A0G3GRX1_9CORY|nr:hypothetical protein [Corynebacterium epidermidicanis]AKK02283.1 hypothetical protein CEPID_02010 [Corynebacterium epidermidicanis]
MSRNISYACACVALLCSLTASFPLPWKTRMVVLWGIVAIVSLALAINEIRLPVKATLRWPVVTGALITVVGAASWVFVGFTAGPGDPVINVTGLLAMVGIPIFCACLLLAAVMDRLPKSLTYSWAPIFAVIQVALFALNMWTLSRVSQWDLEGWYMWGPEFLGLMAAIVQLGVASTMADTLPGKRWAQASGGSFLLSIVSFLVGTVFYLVGIGSAVVAGYFDYRQYVKTKAARTAPMLEPDHGPE